MMKAMPLRLLLLSSLLLLSFAPAEAQPQRSSAFFQHLTVDDGLPENSVRAIVQDEKGFLWFGTQAGLVRYDGYEMHSNWRAAADSVVIPNLLVTTLFEDEIGMLWVGTLVQGLWRVDPGGESIERVECEASGPRVDNQYRSGVSQFSNSSEGGVWVAWSGSGICRHDPEGTCVQQIRHNPSDSASLPSNQVNAVLEDRQGTLWVGTNDRGLGARPPDGEGFRHFDRDPRDDHGLPHEQVNSIYESPDGRIWITDRRTYGALRITTRPAWRR